MMITDGNGDSSMARLVSSVAHNGWSDTTPYLTPTAAQGTNAYP